MEGLSRTGGGPLAGGGARREKGVGAGSANMERVNPQTRLVSVYAF